MDLIRVEDFLSKLCLETFAGYAKTQIKKARGLNKKINRQFDEERKSVLDFCYVVKGKGTIGVKEWLVSMGMRQEDCGLTKLDHFRDSYLIYAGGKGLVSGDGANDVRLSPVEKRNEERYRSTLAHGQSYDAKNMMHTMRLLNMVEEKMLRIEEAYAGADLPDAPDPGKAEELIVRIRELFY